MQNLTFQYLHLGHNFLTQSNIASYVDDNITYHIHPSLDNVTSNLQKSTSSLLNWFIYNHMKVNTDKYHPLVSFYGNCVVKIEDFNKQK